MTIKKLSKSNCLFFLSLLFLLGYSIKSESQELSSYQLGVSYLKELYFNQEELKTSNFLSQVEFCSKAYSKETNALNCLLKKISDPYTAILIPEKAEIERKQIQTIKLGTGIVLDVLDHSVIDRVIAGSPADKAGVRAQDQLRTINDVPLDYLSDQEILYLMEETQEQEIKFGLKRAYDYFELSFQKMPLKTKSLRQKLFRTKSNQKILYLKIDSLLSKKASPELAESLRFANQKQVKNLILDLRDNKGGLLENGIKISELFLDPGQVILKIKSSWGEETIKAKEKSIYQGKLVVLINHKTASSGEIIAGALKDNQRASVIGTRSFGKGFAQRVRELPNGSLMHITVSKFFAPSGQQIDKVGIIPEVEVSSAQAQISEAINYFSLRQD